MSLIWGLLKEPRDVCFCHSVGMTKNTQLLLSVKGPDSGPWPIGPKGLLANIGFLYGTEYGPN